MEIETEGIKISFNAFDAGRLCSVLDCALLNENVIGCNREYALLLKARIEIAFGW